MQKNKINYILNKYNEHKSNFNSIHIQPNNHATNPNNNISISNGASPKHDGQHRHSASNDAANDEPKQ